mmetsp:Transcript_9497/g.13965  ORF Transcript_9497/g.13965 Transcript_9497/m.13965 type:complete len:222 (-) Transcript_9497:505-1170(-)
MAFSMTLRTSSLFSSLASCNGVLPSLSSTSCRPALMQLKFSKRNFAPDSDPWKAAQCKAFHPSSSVIEEVAPTSFNFLMTKSDPSALMATMIMSGVHEFSEVLKFAFFLLIAFLREVTFACSPLSQVSNRISSKDLVLVVIFFLPLPSFSFFRTITWPSAPITSSSSVISSLYFSPNNLRDLGVSSAFKGPPNRIALAKWFSKRLRGPMTLCMARPTIIPL